MGPSKPGPKAMSGGWGDIKIYMHVPVYLCFAAAPYLN